MVYALRDHFPHKYRKNRAKPNFTRLRARHYARSIDHNFFTPKTVYEIFPKIWRHSQTNLHSKKSSKIARSSVTDQSTLFAPQMPLDSTQFSAKKNGNWIATKMFSWFSSHRSCLKLIWKCCCQWFALFVLRIVLVFIYTHEIQHEHWREWVNNHLQITSSHYIGALARTTQRIMCSIEPFIVASFPTSSMKREFSRDQRVRYVVREQKAGWATHDERRKRKKKWNENWMAKIESENIITTRRATPEVGRSIWKQCREMNKLNV